MLGNLLAELDRLEDPDEWDRYGDRGPVAVVETEVAELLGKPAAVFFPSGTMAQQSMLRVWCDRAGSRRVAIPSSRTCSSTSWTARGCSTSSPSNG